MDNHSKRLRKKNISAKFSLKGYVLLTTIRPTNGDVKPGDSLCFSIRVD